MHIVILGAEMAEGGGGGGGVLKSRFILYVTLVKNFFAQKDPPNLCVRMHVCPQQLSPSIEVLILVPKYFVWCLFLYLFLYIVLVRFGTPVE